jgi:hypothetical protein
MLPFRYTSVADDIGLAVRGDVLLRVLEGRHLFEACTPLKNGREDATAPFLLSRFSITD